MVHVYHTAELFHAGHKQPENTCIKKEQKYQ